MHTSKLLRTYFFGSATFLVLFCLTGASNVIAQEFSNDAPATGPYGAVMEYDPSLRPFRTIYRPRDLSAAATHRKIPIVAWGNGGCASNGGVVSRPFLMELASHGYIFVAPGKPAADIDPAEMTKRFGPQPVPGQTVPVTEPPPMPTPPAANDNNNPTLMTRSEAKELIQGIEWLIAENSRDNSNYFNKLDDSKIAAMGHSCGGLQTIAVAKDPRIDTGIVWNSGIFDTSPNPGASVYVVGKDALKDLHSPIAYIQGGPSDIAYKNALDDFSRINNVPIFMGEYGVGHGGTFLKPNGGVYAEVALSWLNWQLKDDDEAKTMFSGKECGFCTREHWKVTRKQME